MQSQGAGTSNKPLFGLPWWFLPFLFAPVAADQDYWSGDYDESKNCVKEDRITQLLNQESQGPDRDSARSKQCAKEMVNGAEGKEVAFGKCKKQLAGFLEKSCSFSSLKNSGEVFYCYNKGMVTCCFDKHSCVMSWGSLQNHVYITARSFLDDPPGFIAKLKDTGYNTCHILKSSLDASVCAADCMSLRKGKFARDCHDKGGFFKCCVRRDAAMCHECRFCCTLGMCTYPTPDSRNPERNDHTKFEDKKLELRDQSNKQTASELFLSLHHFYKSWDYRCLDPQSHSDPTKWSTYNMHTYRTASSKETLAMVDRFKYDPNFNNWMDPKSLKMFADNPAKAWLDSYGFDNVKKVKWSGSNIMTADTTSCHFKCATMENTGFARGCRKSGGFFKCCVTLWVLNCFELARNQLIREGRLKDAKTTSTCWRGRKRRDPCMTCRAVGVCTTMDKMTGRRTQVFTSTYKKEHKVGGPDQSFFTPYGMRLNWCEVADMCESPTFRWEYDNIHFREAVSKKEMCKATQFQRKKASNVTISAQFEKSCMESPSNHIYLCPSKIAKTKSRATQKANKKLKKYLEKQKNKGAMKKKGKKKKKKKKKSKKRKKRTG